MLIIFSAKIIFHLFFKTVFERLLFNPDGSAIYLKTPWSLLQSGRKDNALFTAFPNKRANKN
jgi:hypothetical protein